MLITLTCEIYPTFFRCMGYSIATAMGRVGALTSVFISFPLYWLQSFFPWIGFLCLAFLTSLTTYKLKKDTTGKILDQKLITTTNTSMSDNMELPNL